MSQPASSDSANAPLAGKTALVTGGARRIGRAIALALAASGANVAITYRDSQSEAEDLVGALSAYGVEAFAVRTELTSADSIRHSVAAVVEEFHQLDILVNNAGHFESAALEDLSAEQWDCIFATNTRAPFLVAQAAHPHLRATHGRIVNIGSLGGLHPWTTHAHYCASKAALHMLSQTMAKAWAPEISVNCVAPGMIEIKNAAPQAEAQNKPTKSYAHFAAKTPMLRSGTAQEVSAAVLFFATGPHFITGQLLAVDGGLGL
jgi:3-oxoacyl-[acyl-carrier protein] reductase/pteridine reductase